MIARATVVTMCANALAFGCSSEPAIAEENREIVDNLVQAGFPFDDIMIYDDKVYVGRDAHVTIEASRQMLERDGTTAEQYSCYNCLVSLSISLVCVVPSPEFNTYSRLSDGLDLAIGNYNTLGLSLTFARGPRSECDANISVRTMIGIGGSAGFPSGGLPYPTINIGTGLQSYGVDVNEHVITHEIGHTIGLRHSDFYNRSISCGSGGNEGDAGVGRHPHPGHAHHGDRRRLDHELVLPLDGDRRVHQQRRHRAAVPVLSPRRMRS